MHKRLDALVGEWDVVMTFYIAGGTAEKPIVANGMTCHREWIAETGNRHVRDVTQGTVAGNPYFRLGILSYSTMDKRYEWNTVDALNANMMTYKGAKDSDSVKGEIVMTGEFTDQGVLGGAYAGKNVGQRTVPSNKLAETIVSFERRPRSESRIFYSMLCAAPLNSVVRPLRDYKVIA